MCKVDGSLAVIAKYINKSDTLRTRDRELEGSPLIFYNMMKVVYQLWTAYDTYDRASLRERKVNSTLLKRLLFEVFVS